MDMDSGGAKHVAMDVARRCMRAAVGYGEVIDAISEIILNLIGSEEYALFTADDASSALTLVHSQGIDDAGYHTILLGAGPIGRAAVRDEVSIAGSPPAVWRVEESDLTACIPLRVDGTLTGAIAIFSLLPQTLSVDAIDRDLLTLLGSLAALALHEARIPERMGKSDD
jgi:GAF domain-containing protein